MTEKSNRLVMFDLDGTLIDSVGGIAKSVNVTREQFGFPALPEETVAAYTGDGAKKLLERSFADVELPCSIDEAVARMVENYAANPVWHTTLYPGVKEGLMRLHQHGILLAVVSNKPQLVGNKILEALEVLPLFCENLGGGSGFPLKPAPDTLLHLMKKYSVPQGNAWFVGDNHTDLHAAANAGIRSVFCRYGFGNKADAQSTWEVDSFAEFTDRFLRQQ